MLGGDFKIRVTTGAELDLEEAFVYYSGIDEVLGLRFLVQANQTMAGLSAFWAYEIRAEQIRKIKIPSSSYSC